MFKFCLVAKKMGEKERGEILTIVCLMISVKNILTFPYYPLFFRAFRFNKFSEQH